MLVDQLRRALPTRNSWKNSIKDSVEDRQSDSTGLCASPRSLRRPSKLCRQSLEPQTPLWGLAPARPSPNNYELRSRRGTESPPCFFICLAAFFSFGDSSDCFFCSLPGFFDLDMSFSPDWGHYFGFSGVCRGSLCAAINKIVAMPPSCLYGNEHRSSERILGWQSVKKKERTTKSPRRHYSGPRLQDSGLSWTLS